MIPFNTTTLSANPGRAVHHLKPRSARLAAALIVASAALLGTQSTALADGSDVAGPATDQSPVAGSPKPGSTVTPSGRNSPQKLFNFIAAYFARDKAADMNSDGSIDAKDVFKFLEDYLAGGQ